MNIRNKLGFTLSEVLITLTVIGVIAAITIPSIVREMLWNQYRAGALKAISLLEQTARLYQAQEASNLLCGYWERNPYSAANNGAQCTNRDENGFCRGWQMKDGSPLPGDYNGFFDECDELWNFYKTNMKTVKVCDNNAYANGCIPEYKGIDTLYKGNNSDKTDYEINVATGSSGFRQSSIKTGSAIITADGIIYFTYLNKSARLLAFDVNGFRGPNKWGYDVFAVIPTKRSKYALPQFSRQYAEKSLIEKGGKTLKELTTKV